jgi:hypothetical protein
MVVAVVDVVVAALCHAANELCHRHPIVVVVFEPLFSKANHAAATVFPPPDDHRCCS